MKISFPKLSGPVPFPLNTEALKKKKKRLEELERLREEIEEMIADLELEAASDTPQPLFRPLRNRKPI